MAKYHLNKKEREISDKKELLDILERGKYAAIAMCRSNEPYVVTLNYGFDRGKNALYFHTTQRGLKIEFIRENPLVCATVVEDRGYKMGECSHAYRSVVFWGKMSAVDDITEKKRGFDVLLHHLEENPGEVKERLLKDETRYRDVAILRLDIFDITGKKAQ